MYKCNVCGYPCLTRPPADFMICPCCYTEYGYDDANKSHALLRLEWIQKGMPWMGQNVSPPPDNWNPLEQLAKAGFSGDLYALTGNSTENNVQNVRFPSRHVSSRPIEVIHA